MMMISGLSRVRAAPAPVAPVALRAAAAHLTHKLACPSAVTPVAAGTAQLFFTARRWPAAQEPEGT